MIGPEGTHFYNNEVYASGTYLALEAAKPDDELDAATNELFVVSPGSRSRSVRADELLKTDSAYLFARGPLVGNEVRLAITDEHMEFTFMNPNTRDIIVTLVR